MGRLLLLRTDSLLARLTGGPELWLVVMQVHLGICAPIAKMELILFTYVFWSIDSLTQALLGKPTAAHGEL